MLARSSRVSSHGCSTSRRRDEFGTDKSSIAGRVVNGLDWGITNNGRFSPDAVYVLETEDKTNILVFEKGYAPNVQVLFEAPTNSSYGWLNNVVAYAGGGPVPNSNPLVVALDVWQVSRRALVAALSPSSEEDFLPGTDKGGTRSETRSNSWLP